MCSSQLQGGSSYRLDPEPPLTFATGQPVEVTGSRDGDRMDVVTAQATGAVPTVRTTGLLGWYSPGAGGQAPIT